MNMIIAQGSPGSLIRKVQEDPLIVIGFINWVADFDCIKENCFNHSMETDGGEDICIPCMAKGLLNAYKYNPLEAAPLKNA